LRRIARTSGTNCRYEICLAHLRDAFDAVLAGQSLQISQA
jgi:hypothetical protein